MLRAFRGGYVTECPVLLGNNDVGQLPAEPSTSKDELDVPAIVVFNRHPEFVGYNRALTVRATARTTPVTVNRYDAAPW